MLLGVARRVLMGCLSEAVYLRSDECHEHMRLSEPVYLLQRDDKTDQGGLGQDTIVRQTHRSLNVNTSV